MFVREFLSELRGGTAWASGLVPIQPGDYFDADGQCVVVDQGFLTPPTEVVNDDSALVERMFAETPDGLFVTDTHTDYEYLYALGRAGGSFKMLESGLLPPHLNREVLLANPEARAQALARFRFEEEPVRALPQADRYKKLAAIYAEGDTAVTMVTRRQSQALAQLLGVPEIAAERFGLSGAYYADLPTEKQWGLLAMQDKLEYMTATGQLTGPDGKPLRAFGLGEIVKPRAYPALQNDVFPNTTWNPVKDRKRWCGASWILNVREALRVRYRFLYASVGGDVLNGLRVVFLARTP